MIHYCGFHECIDCFGWDFLLAKNSLQRHILRSQLLKRFSQLQELLLSDRQLARRLQGSDELVYC
ncbi:hypothetical protein DMQ95_27600 [Klebsiella pneumoniae]|nr:hypothetical protein DMQ95_27600 [Klebsiella pneumoniae]